MWNFLGNGKTSVRRMIQQCLLFDEGNYIRGFLIIEENEIRFERIRISGCGSQLPIDLQLVYKELIQPPKFISGGRYYGLFLQSDLKAYHLTFTTVESLLDSYALLMGLYWKRCEETKTEEQNLPP